MGTATIEEKKVQPCSQVTVADLKSARGWQLTVALAIVALCFIYWHTFHWWWGEWWKNESEYSHGVLIPFITGFVVWFNWKTIAKQPVKPSLWGLAFLLPAIAIQFLGHRGGVLSMAGLTLPLSLLGMSLVLFGKQTTRQLLFPILFLYFMCVPPTSIMNKISFQLQMISTTAAVAGLKLVGYEAIQQGQNITMPSGVQLTVAAACSGFRTLITLVTFTTLIAYMLRGPKMGRIGLVAIVVPLGVIVNSLRVFAISVVGELFGNNAMSICHTYSGYVLIVVALLLLIPLAKVVKCGEFKSMPV